MSSREGDTDVVVVGAGLAGLAATLGLQRRGYRVWVVEAADRPGGRVATDHVDGFTLDRGFQLLNPAYPAVRALVDVPALAPHRFWRALHVVDGERARLLGNPLDTPAALTGLIPPSTAGLRDLAALAAFSLRDAGAPARLLTGAADQSTRRELDRWGVSADFRESVLRPFLTGVFGEAELATSARFFHLVWRSFTRAAPVLPAAGMQSLPQQLADRLAPGTLTLDTPVEAVHAGTVLAGGTRLVARAVVVATDADSAAQLLPELPVPGWNGLHTFYYRTNESPLDQPVITIDATGDGPVVNTTVLSAAAPSYAPADASLVGALTLTGAVGATASLQRAVRSHLARLYRTNTAGWELLADYRISHALPAMAAPHRLRAPTRVSPGLYVCGDHRDTSSIQGALASGTRAARAVTAELAGAARRSPS
ncbi:MAG: NAD(P)/FAD-dependent oxidoreductase [Streptosporangiales bacterium]